jgi:hypothetical protein
VSWLIRLYPPAWRRRYGRELAELVATQPVSCRSAVDLVAGAVDAWLNPQSSTALTTTDVNGAGAMLPKMLQLRSGAYSPEVTKADSVKAAAVTIGGTLALVGLLTGATNLYGKNAYFESLLAVGWLLPFLFSQHYTYLKGYPARVQTVLIGGPAMIVIAIALGNAWIGNS